MTVNTNSAMASKTFRTFFASCLLIVFTLGQVPQLAWAQTVNLDLSSTDKNVTAGHSAVIQVGGAPVSVNPGDSLTAAENMALQQIVNTGTQSLVLNALGAATGGSVVTSAVQNATAMNVPAGVTAIHDFGANTLNIAGSLINAGNLYAISSNQNLNTAVLSSASVLNQPHALLTTVLPSGSLAGFNLASLKQNLNLDLNSLGDVINYGTISSAGNLNINAGGAISNLTGGGSVGVMNAVNNVNLTSQLGTFTNSGTVTSNLASINLLTAANANMILNNIAGNIEAANGNVVFRNSGYNGTATTTITDGFIKGQNIILNGGAGNGVLSASSLAGTVNATGSNLTIASNNSSLNLGDVFATNQVTGHANTDLILRGAEVAAGSKVVLTTDIGHIQRVNGRVRANTVELTSGDRSIGSNANPVVVESGTLTANALNGSVFIREQGGTTIKGSTAKDDFVLVADNDISVQGNLATTTNGTVSLTSTNGRITVPFNALVDTGFLTLTAPGHIEVFTRTGDLSVHGNEVEITNYGFGSPLTVHDTGVGRLEVSNDNSITVGNNVTSATSMEFIATGDVTTSTALNAQRITLRGNSGNITLNGDLSGVTVELFTSGNITTNGAKLTGLFGNVASSTPDLTLNTNFGRLALLGGNKVTVNEDDSLELNTLNLKEYTVNAGLVGTGNINLTGSPSGLLVLRLNAGNGGNVDIGSSSFNFIRDEITINAGGNFTHSGININSNGPLTITAGGDVQLNRSLNSANTVITAGGNIIGSPTMNAGGGMMTLTSVNGNIGQSTTPLNVGTSKIFAYAPSGSAYLKHSGSINLAGGGAANDFNFESSGRIGVTGSVTGTNVTLSNTTNGFNGVAIESTGNVSGQNVSLSSQFGSVDVIGGLNASNALNINAKQNINITHDLSTHPAAPGSSTVNSGSVTLTAGGNVSTGNINSAGVSPVQPTPAPYLNGLNGGAGGSISITAAGNVQTGYLRTFGAGGNGSSTFATGGLGGNGGHVDITSTSGSVTVNGDINTSGGGGGGGGYQSSGGSGGNAGTVSIASNGLLTVNGPLLAAGGGGGMGSSCGCTSRSGGGSFGGGGGGGDSGAGGGGLFGGGGSENFAFGQGGGALGGGAAAHWDYANPTDGTPGQGGTGADNYYRGNATEVGGVFGMSGENEYGDRTNFMQTGFGGRGGAPGAAGDVTLSGTTVGINGTVASTYGPLSSETPNPFATSPYADQSIFGNNVSIQTGTISTADHATAQNSFSLTSPTTLNVAGAARIETLSGNLLISSPTINLSGTNNFHAPAGSVTLEALNGINLQGTTSLVSAPSSANTIRTVGFNLANGSALNFLSGSSANFNTTGGGLFFVGVNGGSSTINLSGMTMNADPGPGQDLFFAPQNFTGSTKFNFLGGDLVTTTSFSNARTQISNGVEITTDGNVTMNLHENSFFSSGGTLSSTKAGGNITIQSNQGKDVFFSGCCGTFRYTDGGTGDVDILAPGGRITFLGTQTFNPTPGHNTSMVADTIQFGGLPFGIFVNSGQAISMDAKTVYIGEFAGIGAPSIDLTNTQGGPLTIQLGGIAPANINSPSFTAFSPSDLLVQSQVPGGPNTLNVNGTFSAAANGDVIISEGVTVNAASALNLSAISDVLLDGRLQAPTVTLAGDNILQGMNGSVVSSNLTLLANENAHLSGANQVGLLNAFGGNFINFNNAANLVLGNFANTNLAITADGSVAFSNALHANSLSIVAAGDILLNSVAVSTSNQTAGDITFVAGGSIIGDNSNLTADSFDSFQNGGSITLSAGSGVTVGSISSRNTSALGNGGAVTVQAGGGNLYLPSIDVRGGAAAGHGGMIVLDYSGPYTGSEELRVGSLLSSATDGSGGSVLVNAPDINLTIESVIDTSSLNGDAGDIVLNNGYGGIGFMGPEVLLNASGAPGFSNGNIAITTGLIAHFGEINVTMLAGQPGQGIGGDITFSAGQQQYQTGGGNITMKAGGNVAFSPEMHLIAENQIAGDVLIHAGNNIDLGVSQIIARGQNGVGGNVTLIAENGFVNVDVISVDSWVYDTAGNVTVVAGNGGIHVGEIGATAPFGGFSGGNITLSSTGNIEFRALYANGGEHGGNISVNTPASILPGSLVLASGDLQGGNITISGQFVENPETGTELNAYSPIAGGNIHLNDTSIDGIGLNVLLAVNEQTGNVVLNSGGSIELHTPIVAGNITLNAAGNIPNFMLMDLMAANSISLSAGGSIGDLFAPMFVSTPTLHAVAGGNLNISGNGASEMTVIAGGNANLFNFGDLTIHGSAQNFNVSTEEGGLTAYNVQAVNSMAFSSTHGIDGAELSTQSLFGVAPMVSFQETRANEIAFHATGTASLQLLASATILNSTAGEVFIVAENGDLNIAGDLTATQAIHLLGSNNSDFNLNANLSAGNLIRFDGQDTSALFQISGTLSTPSLTAIALDGSISLFSGVNVNNLLALTQTGNLTVNSLGPISVTGAEAGGNVALLVNGNADLIGTVTGSNVTIATSNNGNIFVGGGVGRSETNAVTLLTSGTGTIFGVGNIRANNTITLRSDIGDLAGLALTAPNVSVNTAGSVQLGVQGPLNLLDSSAGNDFNLIVMGDLNIVGALTANNLNLETDLDGDILINAPVVSQTQANLTASGGIFGATITAPMLTLSAGQQINVTTNAAVMSFNTPDRAWITNGTDVHINDSTAFTVTFTNAGSMNVDTITTFSDLFLRASGNINAASLVSGIIDLQSPIGNITANTQSFELSAHTIGDVVLNNIGGAHLFPSSGNNFSFHNSNGTTVWGIDASGNVQITTDFGDINTASASDASGIIRGGSVSLNAAHGISATTETGNLTANAGWDIVLTNFGNVVLNGANGRNFSLNNIGSVTVAGAVSSQNNIAINTDGSLMLSANMFAPGAMSLSTFGSIDQNAGIIVSPTMNFQTVFGNVGSQFMPILLDAAELTFNAPNGDVHVQDPEHLSISNSLARNIQASAVWELQVGNLQADNMLLSGQNVVFTQPVNATQTVTLAAQNAYSFTPSIPAVVAPVVTIISDGNTGSLDRLSLSTDVLHVQGNGSFFVRNDKALTLNATQSAHNLQITTNGDLTINSAGGNSLAFLTEASGNVIFAGPINVYGFLFVDARGTGDVVNATGAPLNIAFADIRTEAGNIGYPGAPFEIDGVEVALGSQTGSVYAVDPNNLNLIYSTGNVLNVHAAGNLHAQSLQSQHLQLSAGNDLSLASYMWGYQDATFTAGGNINHLYDVVSSPNATFIANGNIGTAGAPIYIDGSLVAIQAGGDAFLYGVNDLSLSGSAGGTLNATSNLLTLSGPVSASVVELQGESIDQMAGTSIAANVLSLNILNGGNALLDQAANNVAILTAAGGGSIDFNNGSSSLHIASLASGQNLDVSTLGTLTTDNLNPGVFTATAGSMVLGNITSNLSVSLVATAGDILTPFSTVTSPAVAIDAFGNVGAAGQPVSLATNTLTASAGNNMFVLSLGALVVNSMTAVNDLQLVATSAVDNIGATSGNNVLIDANSVHNAGSITASNALQLQSLGDLSLTGAGTLAGLTVTLASAGGNVNADQGSVSGNLIGYAQESLTLSTLGSLTTAGLTAVNGDLTVSTPQTLLVTGGDTTAGHNVNLSGGAGLTINSNIGAGTTSGNITATTSGVLTVGDALVLTAINNVTLRGSQGVVIGGVAGSGTTISAGVFASGAAATMDVMQAGSVLHDGSVLIDTFVGGTGTGSVDLGDNVFIISRGGKDGENAGLLHIDSAQDISGNLVNLQAWGGDVWLTAGDDINLTNSNIVSIAKLDDNAATMTLNNGEVIQAYTGGAAALLAGLSHVNTDTLLDSQIADRTKKNTVILSKGALNKSDAQNVVNGGVLAIDLELANQSTSTINDTTFNVDGGVVYIENATATNLITLTNSTFTVVGPAITNGGGSGGGGGGGNFPGGGATGGIFPGGGATGGVFPGHGGNPFKPIAFITALGSATPNLQTANTPTAILKTAGYASAGELDDGTLVVDGGEVLIFADKATKVIAGSTSFDLRAGSIILVSNEGTTVKARNLCDGSLKSTSLKVGTQSITLAPGEEVVIGQSNLKEAMNDSVARRNTQRHEVNSAKVMQSEVSFVSLCQHSNVLGLVMRSPDATDKVIADKATKMAACLTVVTGNHGMYGTR